MFLNEPQPTPYDLRFRIGSVPVTVNPWFWLISLLLSGVGQGTTGVSIVIGVAVVFISILIHELGHAVAMIHYGERVRIVLYGMGGLAINDGFGAWDGARRGSRRSYIQQIIISFAGPLAGFLLAGLVLLVVAAFGWHIIFLSWDPRSGFVTAVPGSQEQYNAVVLTFVWRMLGINIMWGLINLLPVYPLDGGQISRAVFMMFDYRNGQANSLWLSLIAGAGMALLGLQSGNLWLAYLFGMLAFGSWQALQQFRGGNPW